MHHSRAVAFRARDGPRPKKPSAGAGCSRGVDRDARRHNTARPSSPAHDTCTAHEHLIITMPSTMKKIALGALATAAVAAAPASAFTLYSQMPTQAITVTTTVSGTSACTATGVRALRMRECVV